jgi:hypothetical protein
MIQLFNQYCHFVISILLSSEDILDSIMSTVEDLISVMYGHYNQLILSPSHIILFSNQKCPVNMISKDR